MTFKLSKREMLIEAVEHYVFRLKECKANQAAIDVFSELLSELEDEASDTDLPETIELVRELR